MPKFKEGEELKPTTYYIHRNTRKITIASISVPEGYIGVIAKDVPPYAVEIVPKEKIKIEDSHGIIFTMSMEPIDPKDPANTVHIETTIGTVPVNLKLKPEDRRAIPARKNGNIPYEEVVFGNGPTNLQIITGNEAKE